MSLHRPLLLALFAALSLACEKPSSHFFSGYPYDPVKDCIGSAAVIDILDGPDKTCTEVRCWVSPEGSIWITDQACEGPPDFQDHTSTGGPCEPALDAYFLEQRCPDVEPPKDAGS